MKPIGIFLGIVLLLAAGGCADRDEQALSKDEDGIHRGRNTEFSGEHLRVFLTLPDGTDLSVNSADDAVGSPRPATTPIPGHQARDWTFVKATDVGTSVAYALVSWDEDDPADFLMAGWWAEFHGQRPPELALENTTTYAIFDGPEIDPSSPPELPIAGQATYEGQAGGLYEHVLGNSFGEDAGATAVEEYQGTITLTADFAGGTLAGCIGCAGDLVTRRAHFGIFLGDEVRDLRSLAADYELHLGSTPFGPDGFFESTDVEVRHPDRSLTHSEGFWGGQFSNLPDGDGNPRLVAGFSSAGFEEGDGGSGTFLGAFVGLSERFKASGE